MSRAAKRLELSQSAVSQAIANLEKSIGSQLVDRSVRPARLTLLGTTLYKGAQELLAHAKNLEQSVELDMNKSLPLLRIGMVDSFAATVGPHLVKSLDTIAAQWSVQSGSNKTSIRALLERQVDFVISADDTYNLFDLTVLPILEEPFFIVAPASDDPTEKTEEELCQELPLIRYSRSSFLGRQVDDYLREHALNPQCRYELDTSDAVLGMVGAGIGWTIATPLVVLKSARRGDDLRIYPLSKAPMSRKLRLIAQRSENAELTQHIAKAAQDAIFDGFLAQITQLGDSQTSDALRIGAKRLAEFRTHLDAGKSGH